MNLYWDETTVVSPLGCSKTYENPRDSTSLHLTAAFVMIQIYLERLIIGLIFHTKSFVIGYWQTNVLLKIGNWKTWHAFPNLLLKLNRYAFKVLKSVYHLPFFVITFPTNNIVPGFTLLSITIYALPHSSVIFMIINF